MFSNNCQKLLVNILVVLFILIFFACDSNNGSDTENNNHSAEESSSVNQEVNYRVYGLNFSPYIEDQDPNFGVEISEEQIRTRMEIIAGNTSWIRTFGSTHGLEKCGFIAHDLGLKAALGAWLDANKTTNEEEINNLIMNAKAGDADMLIVGSEVLLRQDLSEEELIDYINRIKEEVPDIPVAYADTYATFLNHPNIIDSIDVIMVNYYPYWEGIRVEDAVAVLNYWHQKILEIAGGKKVIVSETGWPSDGEQIGDAIPSLDNASYYFLNFVSWARANNVDYFYFEAFDEPWKAKYEGPQGAHWGIWDKDGNMKQGMNRVFEGEIMEDNWSEFPVPGGPGDPTIELTYIPPYGSFENLKGQVWHVNPYEYNIVVYIYVKPGIYLNGGWWIKPYANNPLTPINYDGSWECDITTGGVDQNATKIAVFLVPDGYEPPCLGNAPSLPSELDENAAAKLEIERTP